MDLLAQYGTTGATVWQASEVRRSVLLVVVALGLVGIEGCSGASNQACRLLTSRDIAAVLGSSPAGRSGTAGGGTQSCQYHGPTFALLTVELVKSAPAPAGPDAVPVTNVGRQAVAVGQTLYVNTGNGSLVIGLDMPIVAVQQARARQVALARIALNRL